MRAVIAAWIVLALAGCAQVGLAPAQSFSERLAYGYSSVAGLRTTCAQALSSGAATVDTAQKCLSITDTARASLDAAALASTNGAQPVALQDLAAATAALAELQQFLTSKGVK